MRMTQYSDYFLRVLMYLAAQMDGRLVQIKEIADTYKISKNHLMKVTHELSKLGLIRTVRGRNGGITLGKKPEEINIGELIRRTEEDFYLVECFDAEHNKCIISPACKLRGVLNKALSAYFEVLDQYTLADLTRNVDQLQTLFSVEQE
ncbi:RrF2 family transcriptional regulator [Pseudalkalibacillus berkeleyi]|uniref:HTH-type transcriptional regulator NsrR n=1 Tax=Pseudalkalibacillus berkeleyi TaxID=1069813 RepID=A0ABS9H222_9BACL|nr:Rrf2 family transcriptional regulator [Pseudalkalibacillus berkeleyi]MCF6139017.1 Rrf2 family transcriptional regulator [Pseudalkalibacillus berkeleyi]